MLLNIAITSVFNYLQLLYTEVKGILPKHPECRKGCFGLNWLREPVVKQHLLFTKKVVVHNFTVF